jgi:hypothetical protein
MTTWVAFLALLCIYVWNSNVRMSHWTTTRKLFETDAEHWSRSVKVPCASLATFVAACPSAVCPPPHPARFPCRPFSSRSLGGAGWGCGMHVRLAEGEQRDSFGSQLGRRLGQCQSRAMASQARERKGRWYLLPVQVPTVSPHSLRHVLLQWGAGSCTYPHSRFRIAYCSIKRELSEALLALCLAWKCLTVDAPCMRVSFAISLSQ